MTIWTQVEPRLWSAVLDGIEYLLTRRGDSWWLLCGAAVLRRYAGQMSEGEALEVGEIDASRAAYTLDRYHAACREGR